MPTFLMPTSGGSIDMGIRISAWYGSLGSTAKAIVALIAIIMLTATSTLAVTRQVGLPARVLVVETDVSVLKLRAETNRQGIEEVRRDTQTILCILTLPSTISPAESRLRCP